MSENKVSDTSYEFNWFISSSNVSGRDVSPRFVSSEDFPNDITDEHRWKLLMIATYFHGSGWFLDINLAYLPSPEASMCTKIIKVELQVGAGDCKRVIFPFSIAPYKWSSLTRFKLMEVPANLGQIVTGLHTGRICIQCTIHLVGEEVKAKESCKKEAGGGPFTKNLLSDLGSLLNDEKFADVTFAVDGKQIFAHKSILAKRSPVFDAMFSHGTTECKDGLVTIDDFSYETLHQMLRFIYTSNVKGFDNGVSAAELLAAADKYDLEGLRELCADHIVTSISVDNAVEALIFADRHRVDRLKRRANHFICDHANEIARTPEFKRLPGHLTQELFMILASKSIENKK